MPLHELFYGDTATTPATRTTELKRVLGRSDVGALDIRMIEREGGGWVITYDGPALPNATPVLTSPWVDARIDPADDTKEIEGGSATKKAKRKAKKKTQSKASKRKRTKKKRTS